ncbi:MAG: tetratricopeptide repeat protein [Verrucomicrobiia bacterium]
MKDAWRSRGAGAVLIIVLTVVAYLPAMRGGFIWDDDYYVTENPLLTATDGLRRIWFSTHHQSQYFPLVYTTLRFERMLWGLNPMGYHVVNVLLHSLNALLVWAVLKRLALPGAWLAAAIFALHPVHVESVAWITELKNTQSTLFYLLALLAWMKFADKETTRPWRFYATALLLHALALFCKTTACTLPAAMVLVLWVRDQPIGWRRIAQVVPFLVLGATMGLVSVWWEAHLGHYQGTYFAFSVLERLLIASRAVWFYALKLVWPTNLTFSYPRWQINPRDPLQYVWLTGCVAVALVLWWRRNNWGRGCAGAVIFFVATLSPLLGFIPLYTFRFSFVADHYQYLPSIGLIALSTAAISRQAAALHVSFHMRCALSLLLLLVLGVSTWRQAHAYQDPETLWRDTLTKNPSSWIAHCNLGAVLERLGKLSEAKEHFEQALRIEPDCAEAHYNLGISLARAGRLEDAIRHYEQALRLINSDYPKTYNNLGNALLKLGKLSEAKERFEQALRIRPDYAEAHNNLGIVLARLGRVQEAIGHYEQALRIKPDYAEVHFNLGNALSLVGKPEEVVGQYEQALRIKPDIAEAHCNLGIVLARLGRVQEAIGHYEQALQIKPDYPDAQNNLAWLLATLAPAEGGDPVRAVTLAQRACERTGNRRPAYLDTLAAAYAATGRFNDAVATAEKAVELARSAGQSQVVDEIEARLRLYRDGRVYRQTRTPVRSQSADVTSPDNP